MEPTLALRSIETALRLAVQAVLGDAWSKASGAPDTEALEARRVEDGKRRDGVIASDSLLNFTETSHLTSLIEANWEKFKPIFDDKARTIAYFEVVNDVRNSIAHSRDLVPFERDLISGIAGQLRNQVSLFRSTRDGSLKYYPRIESLRDGFGSEAADPNKAATLSIEIPRVEVGQTIDFSGSAFMARGKPVSWWLQRNMAMYGREPIKVSEGDDVAFSYTIQEADVGEHFELYVYIRTDSKYHRVTGDTPRVEPCDDLRMFIYAVNPPD